MKQFAVCIEDLNQIQERMNDMEDFESDQYDLIAPGIQNVEYSQTLMRTITCLMILEFLQLT